jgi:hypothetical protein
MKIKMNKLLQVEDMPKISARVEKRRHIVTNSSNYKSGSAIKTVYTYSIGLLAVQISKWGRLSKASQYPLAFLSSSGITWTFHSIQSSVCGTLLIDFL